MRKFANLLFLTAALLLTMACSSSEPAAEATPFPTRPLQPTATASPLPAAPNTAAMDVEMGRTEDGRFYTLGRPDAPVTFTDYSDFL